MRFNPALLAVALAASPFLANAAQRTYANPVDIDYRYNFEQMNEGISYRTGADPVIVRYGDAYYLFQTLVAGGKLFLMPSAFGPRPLMASTDPAHGHHGWERFGPDHSMGDKPSYIEGSWMNKHKGRYYFQYAAPGTEYNVYGTGVYVGKGPLGPFEYGPYNPVGYNVRWGLGADRLHSTYQRFADQPTSFTLRSLNKGVRYVVAVEAFDERGVSPLSQVVQIVP